MSTPLARFLFLDYIPAMNSNTPAYQAMLDEGKKRRARALEMQVKEHKSLSEIGAELGVSRQRAAAMITAARKDAARK